MDRAAATALRSRYCRYIFWVFGRLGCVAVSLIQKYERALTAIILARLGTNLLTALACLSAEFFDSIVIVAASRYCHLLIEASPQTNLLLLLLHPVIQHLYLALNSRILVLLHTFML